MQCVASMSQHRVRLLCLINPHTDDREFYVFDPPSGQQCGEYAMAFVQEQGGYINNLNATSGCQYCNYRTGDEFYKPFTIAFDDRWRDLGIFCGFLVFNVVVVRLISIQSPRLLVLIDTLLPARLSLPPVSFDSPNDRPQSFQCSGIHYDSLPARA